MTPSVFRPLPWLAILCVSLWAQQAAADDRRDFTKVIKKEFATTADGTVEVHNKYGRVDVKTWDHNKVKLQVTITVKAGSEKEAQSTFDRIDIQISNRSNYVKAQTEISSASEGFFSFFGWGGSSSSDFTIDYDLYVPAGNGLTVSNRYGNVFVSNLTGKANVDVRYGHAKLEGLQGPVDLSVAYGKASVGTTGSVKLNTSYSTLTVGAVRDVELTSKYSKVNIDAAGLVRCDSRYDNYSLGKIEELRNTGRYDNFSVQQADRLVVSTQYTQIKATHVGRILDLDTRYGDVNVGSMGRDFSLVSLNGQYTGFKIGIPEGAAFDLDAIADYAGINYPKVVTLTYDVKRNSYHEVRGSTGGTSDRGLIKARLRYGSLRLQHP